ncbi:hypothetical protein KAW80_03660 [Candidatus Babeliales bacterium]|nr:hypothetical protein [Candidatus Babeliales bacterium]
MTIKGFKLAWMLIGIFSIGISSISTQDSQLKITDKSIEAMPKVSPPNAKANYKSEKKVASNKKEELLSSDLEKKVFSFSYFMNSIKNRLYKAYNRFKKSIDLRIQAQENEIRLQKESVNNFSTRLDFFSQTLQQSEKRLFSDLQSGKEDVSRKVKVVEDKVRSLDSSVTNFVSAQNIDVEERLSSQTADIEDKFKGVKSELLFLKKDVRKEKERLLSKLEYSNERYEMVKKLELIELTIKNLESKHSYLDDQLKSMLNTVISTTQELVKKELDKRLKGLYKSLKINGGDSRGQRVEDLKANLNNGDISQFIKNEVKRQIYVPKEVARNKRIYYEEPARPKVRRYYVEDDLD